MFSLRGAASEREFPPGVCTPPRDDLTSHPRIVHTPRDSHFRSPGTEHPALAATRQACSILVLIGCIFVVGFAVVAGLYMAVSAMVKNSTVVGHCEEQPISNGVIKSGFENSTAEVRCGPGFKRRTLPEGAGNLRCRLLARRCIVWKAETAYDGPIRKCKHTYAFTLPFHEPHGLRAGSLTLGDEVPEEEQAVAEARIKADTATRGACLPEEVRQEPSSLYGKQRRPLPLESEVPVPASAVRWTIAASSISMSSLMLLSMASLVSAGVIRARAGDRSGHSEPDTALLLDPRAYDDEEPRQSQPTIRETEDDCASAGPAG